MVGETVAGVLVGGRRDRVQASDDRVQALHDRVQALDDRVQVLGDRVSFSLVEVLDFSLTTFASSLLKVQGCPSLLPS